MPPPAADPPPVDVTVVLPVTDGFRRVCWWLRRLYRTEVVRAGTSLELLVVAGTDADRRIAAVTALSLPGTRVVRSADRVAGAVTVVADPALEPPDWPWLHHLVDRLADPSVGRVGPLLVEADQTVVSAGALPAPFLRGETPADAARAAHLPVPDLGPGVVAFRTADGPRDPAYVVPDARVVVPPSRAGRAAAEERGGGSTSEAERWRAAGFEGPGRPLRVVEGRPALRWAIDIAAPLAPRGRRWGDDPFARSLAAALERRGQWVTVDHPETRARRSRDHDDVVLVLRGLDPVAPTPADAGVAARLLWIISHPAEVTAAECAPYDLVLAAGPAWARQRTQDWGREVRTLLQCTDATRFHPGLAESDSGPEVLFVGNSRGSCGRWCGPRWTPASRSRSTATAGPTWSTRPWSPGCTCRTTRWARSTPPPAWCSATTGTTCARSASSPTGPSTCWPPAPGSCPTTWPASATSTPTCSTSRCRPGGTRQDLRRLAEPGWRADFPDAAGRLRAAERVVAEHSFDARAGQLLDAALTVVGRPT